MDGAWPIEALLVWTYRDQAADSLANRGGGGPGGYRGVFQTIQWRAALGASIDCIGSGGVGGELHPDAETVHGAVKAMDATSIGLVITHAKDGTRPDWLPDTTVRVHRFVRSNGNVIVEYGPDKRPSYCPVWYDPSPEHVAFMRGVWTAWWDAMDRLAARLDGEVGRKVLGPDFAREPWLVQSALDTAEKL